MRRAASVAALLLGLCGCNPVDRIVSGRILHPEPDLPLAPQVLGMPAEDVRFRDGRGRLLQGWFLTCENPEGAVFLCKGSDGTVSSFFEVARFLHEARLQVFLFDYAGCGRSEGPRSLATLPDQVRSAWEAFLQRPGLRRDRLGVYGISLGAPAAFHLMADHPEVGAGVFESLFDPPRALSKVCGPVTAWMGRHWILDGPSRLAAWSEAVGDRPVLFVVPTLDFLDFPLEAVRPGRRLWAAPAVHHPLTLCCPGYRERVTALFLEAFHPGEGAGASSGSARVLSWNPEGPAATPGSSEAFLKGLSRVYHVLPSECRMLVLPLPEGPPDPRGIPMEVSAALPVPSGEAGSGETVKVSVVLESPRQEAVELAALSDQGRVIGRGRGWCGPGRTTLSFPVLGGGAGKLQAVCLCPCPHPRPLKDSWEEKDPAERLFLEMDLAASSAAAGAEEAWVLDRLQEDGLSQDATWFLVSRWAGLQGEGAGSSFERASQALAQRVPGLEPRVRAWIEELYPDFGHGALGDLPAWIEARREILHPADRSSQVSGSFRLDPDHPGALLRVGTFDADSWRDVELWAGAVRLDAPGRRAILPPGTRQVLVKQGRLEMVQEIPPSPCAALLLDLDRLSRQAGPWLGVEFSGEGKVRPLAGGPAERAGMRPGDRVLAVDGKPLASEDILALRRAILHHAPGDVLALDLARGPSEKLSLSVTLEKRPPSERKP